MKKTITIIVLVSIILSIHAHRLSTVYKLMKIGKEPRFAERSALYKDGGTTKYSGFLYEITDFNQLNGRKDIKFSSLFFVKSIEDTKVIKKEDIPIENVKGQIAVYDAKTIILIKSAVKSATKQSGLVNMADPHYQIKADSELYSLWLTEDSGTLMTNTQDTHTIYTLTEQGITDFKKIINESK
ncbi:MAG: hypothetical protein K0S51_1250 [Bacillales bacterium]|jgi:hypothetical protein|nr:hypothetical protein [Bacillales bacterium]